jgi:hypothetical protein
LIADMRSEAQDSGLIQLIDACEEIGRGMMALDADDKLAGSYPFLTMLSVAVCGWLMERLGRATEGATGDAAFLAMKKAATRFYVEQIVPEALGLKAAATARADVLYSVEAQAFAA